MLAGKLYGLIGNPLRHSFSQKYFADKFLALGLNNYSYKLFELKNLGELTEILLENDLSGFNVTSPYKKEIFDYLDDVSPIANEIGAVNCVKITDKGLTGYNTDWFGFKESLLQNTDVKQIRNAIILGTGGAAKAVAYALQTLKINYTFVSRTNKISNTINYLELNTKDFNSLDLIINATPCGLESYPLITDIDTSKITDKHCVFDLIYNPSQTLLLEKAKQQGAKIINGLQMLYEQAEYSWRIWTNNDYDLD